VSSYGIIAGESVGEGVWRIRDMVEKPDPGAAPSELAIIGRYLLPAEIFPALDAVTPGAGGEIQLTDAMARMCGRGEFHGYRFEGKRFDCGDKLGFFEANIAFAMAREDLGAGAKEILRTYL
jgi:UTP--glucose-1-phosphate uridylyltransferase